VAADLQLSSGVRRLASALLDGAAALLVTGLLASTVGMYWAQRAVVTFRIEDPQSPWKGIGPMLLGLTGPVAYGFAAGLVLVLLGELMFGTSPGKLVTKTWILTANESRAPMGPLAIRFLVKMSGPLLYCLALITGRWEILPLAAIAGLTILVGGFGQWISKGRTFHDRAAGTSVFLT
jgi:hypothetical protein